MKHVLFVRLKVEHADDITNRLSTLYREGWRIVAMSADSGEYCFVLES